MPPRPRWTAVAPAANYHSDAVAPALSAHPPNPDPHLLQLHSAAFMYGPFVCAYLAFYCRGSPSCYPPPHPHSPPTPPSFMLSSQPVTFLQDIHKFKSKLFSLSEIPLKTVYFFHPLTSKIQDVIVTTPSCSISQCRPETEK